MTGATNANEARRLAIRSGMARARAAGKHVGRRPLDPEVLERARELRAAGMSWSRIALALRISPSSAWRACQKGLVPLGDRQDPP